MTKLFLGAAAFGVIALGASAAGAQTPSQIFGPDRDECVPSIAATAGHDLLGRNMLAGRPFDAEHPECNVLVSRTGEVVKPAKVSDNKRHWYQRLTSIFHDRRDEPRKAKDKTDKRG